MGSVGWVEGPESSPVHTPPYRSRTESGGDENVHDTLKVVDVALPPVTAPDDDRVGGPGPEVVAVGVRQEEVDVAPVPGEPPGGSAPRVGRLAIWAARLTAVPTGPPHRVVCVAVRRHSQGHSTSPSVDRSTFFQGTPTLSPTHDG